jgi:hypothetical protein
LSFNIFTLLFHYQIIRTWQVSTILSGNDALAHGETAVAFDLSRLACLKSSINLALYAVRIRLNEHTPASFSAMSLFISARVVQVWQAEGVDTPYYYYLAQW